MMATLETAMIAVGEEKKNKGREMSFDIDL